MEELLEQNYNNRKLCWKENYDDLIKMRDVKKGTRYRKWLFLQLNRLAETKFENEEDEYKAIKKFPRGIWFNYYNTFKTKKELDFMIKISRTMGAFDY